VGLILGSAAMLAGSVGVGVVGVGCKDIGRGGTGEMVVPEDVLREIKTVEPENFATTPPTTAPSTMPSTRASTQPLKDVPITVDDVRKLAIQNNLDIKVDVVSPSLARESLNVEEAAYEWTFNTDAGFSASDQPINNVVQQQLSGSQSQNWRVTPGLNVPLRTGGTVNMSVPWTESDVQGSSANVFNPLYTSDFAASLNQPLLRGGGIDVNAQHIRIAYYGFQQAQAAAKLEIIQVLAQADRVYWQFYAAREALAVRRQEYDLAVQQLERARHQVRAGISPEVEIVRAQSGVSDRVEAIINADNLARDRERDLKRTLNDPDFDMQSPTILVPKTQPVPLYFKVDPDRLVTTAMRQRMELLEAELSIALDTASVRVARHEMLPLVNLQYNYNINGLGGSTQDSFAMVRTTDFQENAVGIHLEIPIGNDAARSRLRQALLQRIQDIATKAQREAQIRQEVLNAIDQLDANWQRILAARQRVILNQRLLEVEIRQFDQGLRTSTEVLNAQTDLANAKLSEISALTDYQVAQVDIAFATGTLLGASHVMWEPSPQPRP
jgi:outer membrane protein TolC